MTPKEKAIELTDSFYVILDGNVTFEQVKQCALIAVEEIIEIEPYKRKFRLFDKARFDDQIQYWQQVKKEIEKL